MNAIVNAPAAPAGAIAAPSTPAAPRRRSIAVQLALGLTLMTGLLWIAAATISVAVTMHEVNKAYDHALRQSASWLLPLAIHDIREPDERRRPETGEVEEEGILTYLARDEHGTVVLNDGNAPEDLVAGLHEEGYYDTATGRAYVAPPGRRGYDVVVFEAPGVRQHALLEGILALLLPLFALLPLVGLGVLYALRIALRPLENLRRDIAARDRHNLSPLTADGHPEELAPIAGEVAGLLARLQSALDAERIFAASSAHELRTPIAGALAQTQLLASELKGTPTAPRVRAVEKSLRKLGTLAERLLQFARIEAGFARSDQEVDLRPVVELVVRDFTAAGAEVTLIAAPDARLMAHINPDAFALAVRNLIDNAVRHGAPKSPVRVHLGPGPSLRVVNDGPPVPPAVLAELGLPFVRGKENTEGTGIGLCIVRAIMDQTAGALTLNSPISGQRTGFEARLILGA